MVNLYGRPQRTRGFQIGPRIRVGGTLGKIGQGLKIGAGKALSNPIVDTALAFVPGVGPGLSAAANAAGHVLDTSGGGIHSAGDVANVGLDAAKQYGLSKLATSIPGIIKGATSGGGLNLGGLAKGAAGLFGGGGAAGGAGGAGGGGGLDLGTLLRGGLGAAGLLNASHLSDKSNEFADKAVGNVEGSYNARAPLRTAGIAGLLNPGAGVPLATAGVQANTGVGNPFSRKPGVAL